MTTNKEYALGIIAEYKEQIAKLSCEHLLEKQKAQGIVLEDYCDMGIHNAFLNLYSDFLVLEQDISSMNYYAGNVESSLFNYVDREASLPSKVYSFVNAA
ncbi:MAG: hypothetical protein CVU86_06370 [Firmicutes bacterium HGW-Firmicutes-11]|jgi:hypothetical protein|nr:MAG: hypothetical protein CVU86_06370 [Firmicutes bacterium HGW-Firmicutes-11]